MVFSRRSFLWVAGGLAVAVLGVGYLVWWQGTTTEPPSFEFTQDSDEAAAPVLDLYVNALGLAPSSVELALATARYDSAIRCAHDAGIDASREKIARAVEAPISALRVVREGTQLVVTVPAGPEVPSDLQPCIETAMTQYPDPTAPFVDFLHASLPIPVASVAEFATSNEVIIKQLAADGQPALSKLAAWIPED